MCPTSWYDYPGYFVNPEDKWPMVDPEQHGTVRVEGVLTGIEISDLDSPFLHDSHDLDMTMSVQPDSGWVPLEGQLGLVLETESAGFPPYARPAQNDHIVAIGRWIFDCGHDPKTEVHPICIFESDRTEFRPLYPGGRLQKV
jgi:hypothetical protein